jgi:protein tyrosine/serine phosphatase
MTMYRRTMLMGWGMVVLAVLVSVPAFPATAALKAGEMKDFRIVTPGVLSRSGLPSGKDLLSLSNKGWKTVIPLISAGEISAYKKIDPTTTPAFKQSGLRKIPIIIGESKPPTDAEARQFLSIVTNPKHQPVHVYCRKGHARTGTMVALYRYSVEGWSMAKAIREAKRYGSGISPKQSAWLREWAKTHVAGGYR